MLFSSLLSFILFNFNNITQLLSLRQSVAEKSSFQWQEITPSKSLQFHACFDGFECARLSVPLDWNTTRAETNAAIAIIKRRGKVSTTDPRYGGMVVLNPGGPGASGVEMMLEQGKYFQTIIDGGRSPNSQSGNEEPISFFDVISFDPRGVNNTTPAFSCFNDEMMSQAWDIQGQSIGLLGSSNTSFEQVWSRSMALAYSCATHPSAFKNSHCEHVGQYINTSPVVRDMVEIVERYGEWRERDVRKQLLNLDWSRSSEKYQAALERGIWKKGQEKLLYWGLSYGTFLGQAFASLQPHRVGRMVLDGVMDTDDYTKGIGKMHLVDTEKVLKSLFTQCLEAGIERCPLATDNISTSTGLALRLEELFYTLAISPISAVGHRGPTVITTSDLATMIFRSIYRPMNGFPVISNIVSDLILENGTSFAVYKEQLLPTTLSSPPIAPSWSGKYTTNAILCADGDSLYNLSRSFFEKRLAFFRAQSPLFADVLATLQLSCLHWPIRPKWRYEGPFGGKTAYPILFVSQNLDPVTPFQNAKSAAQKFDGARLIECAGQGHCSIAMPSLCTAKAIGDYFQKGILPSQGTVCAVDAKPFDPDWKMRSKGIQDSAEKNIREAIEFLAETSVSSLPNINL